VNKPGIRKSIGKNTGPNNIPNIFNLEENIIPIVTKYAAKTNGRKERGIASYLARHPT
jgi:hypothetical protein